MSINTSLLSALAPLLMTLTLAASGCADDPSPLEEAAHHFCQCNAIINGEAPTVDLSACEAEVTVALKAEMASCITCLNQTITDSPTEATCAASFDCPTCTADQ